jgi:hypothetical protein
MVSDMAIFSNHSQDGLRNCNGDKSQIAALGYSCMVVLGSVNRIVIADTRDTNAAAVLRYCMLAAISGDMKRSIVLKMKPAANDANKKPFVFPSRSPVEPEHYPQHVDPEEYT